MNVKVVFVGRRQKLRQYLSLLYGNSFVIEKVIVKCVIFEL